MATEDRPDPSPPNMNYSQARKVWDAFMESKRAEAMTSFNGVLSDLTPDPNQSYPKMSQQSGSQESAWKKDMRSRHRQAAALLKQVAEGLEIVGNATD